MSRIERLTDAFEIITLMQDGWQLGTSAGRMGCPRSTWIQQGGLGCGGKTKNVHYSTLKAMLRKGLIVADEKRPNYGIRAFSRPGP